MSRHPIRTVAALAALAIGTLASTAASASPAALTSLSPAGVTAPAATQVWYRHGWGGGWGWGYPRPYVGFYAPAPLYVAPSGCGWLHARAVNTGSRYWWNRYRACID